MRLEKSIDAIGDGRGQKWRNGIADLSGDLDLAADEHEIIRE